MIRSFLLLLLLASPACAEPVPGAASVVNALRAEAGLAPLTLSAPLQQAAESLASDMARGGFFSHTGSNGSSVGTRAQAQGYRYCTIAENIAMGQGTLSEVMSGWINSPPHLRNMLLDRVTEFALARQSGDIWVMVLGRPGC